MQGNAETLDELRWAANTVMSYRDYPGDVLARTDLGGGIKEGIGSLDTPQSYMMLDIAALQYLYSANFVSNGDTVYKFTPTI